MIPREIDELMWTIAESGDPDAISEFGNRYPNQREELLKRLKTVNALKDGRRSVKVGAVPTFRNTQVQPVNWRPLFAVLAASILAISSLGIWRSINAPKPVANVPAINVEAPKLPEANIQSNDEPRVNPAPQHTNQEQPLANPPVVPPPTVDPAKTSVRLESASLHAAITLIADAGHLKVTIASGTPDPTVHVDFQEMTPMAMLKELGQQYAFDILLDGDRAILILPKKDEEEDQMTNESH